MARSGRGMMRQAGGGWARVGKEWEGWGFGSRTTDEGRVGGAKYY